MVAMYMRVFIRNYDARILEAIITFFLMRHVSCNLIVCRTNIRIYDKLDKKVLMVRFDLSRLTLSEYDASTTCIENITTSHQPTSSSLVLFYSLVESCIYLPPVLRTLYWLVSFFGTLCVHLVY